MKECYCCYNTGSDRDCPCKSENKTEDSFNHLFKVPVTFHFYRELNPDEVMELIRRLDEVALELFGEDYDGYGLNVAEVNRQL